jgi:hypothetical protein
VPAVVGKEQSVALLPEPQARLILVVVEVVATTLLRPIKTVALGVLVSLFLLFPNKPLCRFLAG